MVGQRPGFVPGHGRADITKQRRGIGSEVWNSGRRAVDALALLVADQRRGRWPPLAQHLGAAAPTPWQAEHFSAKIDGLP